MFAVEASSAQRKAARFYRAGGNDIEVLLPLQDALPCAFLGGGGCAEGGAEPVAYGCRRSGRVRQIHVSNMAGFMVCLLNCWGLGRKDVLDKPVMF